MGFPKFSNWFKIVIGVISLLLLWHFISVWPWLILFGTIAFVYRYFKNKPPGSPLSRYAHLYLLFITLIVSLSIGEIALRTIGKNASYKEINKSFVPRIILTYYSSPFNYTGRLLKYKPYERDRGAHTKEFHYAKPTNSQGYVDREWTMQKKKKHRFIFFGDSFTEGVGAPIDSSYVACFQRLAADSIEMYNAGIAGSDPCSEYMLLQEDVLKYKPDRIYVAINESDISDVMAWGGLERFRDDGEVDLKKKPWWEGIYARSFLFRLYIHQYRGLDWLFYTPAQAEVEHQLAIKKLQHCLDLFQTLATQNGMECIFIFHPLPDEVINQTIAVEPILAYAKSKNYISVNILDAYIKRGVNADNIGTYFWRTDRHNKAAGYQLFAEGLAETI